MELSGETLEDIKEARRQIKQGKGISTKGLKNMRKPVEIDAEKLVKKILKDYEGVIDYLADK